MPDNVTADPGSGGATFKTDEDTGASAHVPVTKIELGANNSFDGYVSATNPIPAELSDGTTTVAVGGGVQASALRVTVASDSTGVLSVDDNDSSISIDTATGAIDVSAATVTVDTELPAAAAMADGAANPTVPAVGARASVFNGTTWDRMRGNTTGTYVHGSIAHDGVDQGNPLKIGGRAYTALPTAVAGNDRTNAVFTTTGGQVTAGVDGTTPRNIAVNASGQLEVDISAQQGAALDVSGATVTVTGTVTADLGATDNAVLDQIEVNTSYGDNTGNGTAAGALRVTVASDSTGALTVDLGSNNDVVGTTADDAAAATNPILIGAVAVETDGTDPTSVSAESDVARLRSDRNRRLLVNDAHPNLWDAAENNGAATSNNELKAAPGAGLSLYITDLIISNGATAGSIKFVEDTGGTPIDVIEEIYLAANGGFTHSFKTPLRISANTNFGYTSTTVTTHSVNATGYIAP